MSLKNTAKIIKSGDLDAISWCHTGSPVGLSDRAMRLFQLLKSALIITAGAGVLKTTIAELARAHTRACLGACSPATVRRALAELEDKNYLIRSQCRLGGDARGLKIVFDLDRWAYWIQRKTPSVKPMPTSVYISPGQSNRVAEDRTTTTHVANSQYSSKSRNNMQKADKKIYKYHPILFTLWAVLKKDGAKVPHRDPIYQRAKMELEADAAGVQIANHTGVPWSQHEKNWRKMLPTTRESFARSQIFPFFRSTAPRPDEGLPSSSTAPRPDEGLPSSSIRAIIERSIESTRIVSSKSDEIPENTLNISDLEVLISARNRAKRANP